MRAGKLDRVIVIQRATYETDGAGGLVLTWSDIATLRAQLVQASTEEFIRAYGASAEALTIFRTRWLAGVLTSDRVLYNGLAHNIKELKEIGRAEGLEIRTVSLGEEV